MLLFGVFLALLFEEHVFTVNFGEGGYPFDEFHQSCVFFLQLSPFAVAQDVTDFFLPKTIHRVVVLIVIGAIFIIVQGSTFFHVFFIDFDQGFVMKFIFFKDLDGFVGVGVVNI